LGDGLLERDAPLAQLGVLARRVVRGSSGEVVLLRGDALTGRQRQVFDVLAAGRSNREIAAELNISPKTVGHHVEAILAKLGVENRTHAVAYALQSQAASQSQS
jgi:DNA-binding NarL/FixJ family response regulator